MKAIFDRFYIILILAALGSCRQNEIYFTDALREYDRDDVERLDTLKGVVVVNEAIGAFNIASADSLLCLSTMGNPLFGIYNLEGDSLSHTGFRGNGPCDFTSNRLNGQGFSDSSACGVWVCDVNSSCLKRLNLTRSLQDGSSVVDSAIAIHGSVTHAFVSGDTVVQEIPYENNYKLRISRPDGVVIWEEPLYKIEMNPRDLFTAYNSSMTLSPDGSHIVMAMAYINQINIIDIKDGLRRYALTLGGVSNIDGILDSKTNLPLHTYYSSVAPARDRIYALFENRPLLTESGVNRTGELHIAGYDGSLIATAPLDRFLYAIAYSSLDNSLYGIDEQFAVVKYNVPQQR